MPRADNLLRLQWGVLQNGPTRDRVHHAAEELGFYGLGVIEHSVRKSRATHKLGVLLQQESRTFYQNLGKELHTAAETYPDANIKLTLIHLEDLSPDNVSNALLEMSETCDSIALVAAQHPLVAQAIQSVMQKGIPVTGLIAPLYAADNVNFVGLDNWKVGRVAAWAFDKWSENQGKLAFWSATRAIKTKNLTRVDSDPISVKTIQNLHCWNHCQPMNPRLLAVNWWKIC